LDHKEIVRFIIDNSGSHFDPYVVDAFEKLFAPKSRAQGSYAVSGLQECGPDAERLLPGPTDTRRSMDAMSDGIWDWRIDRYQPYLFSPRWYTMFGYEPYKLPETFDS
jgi:hypothetical protein